MHNSTIYVFFYFNLINKYNINVDLFRLGQGAVTASYKGANKISDFLEDEEIAELNNVTLSERVLLYGCSCLAR
jgi:hypothetical protein